MRRLLIAAVAAFSCGLSRGADLGEIFSDKSAWSMTADKFLADYGPAGFNPGNSSRSFAKCLVKGAFTWHGLDVLESRVYFAEGGVQRVELSLYNRGYGYDTILRPYGKTELKKLLDDIRSKVSSKPSAAKSHKPKTGMVVYEQTWFGQDPKIELLWGETSKSKAETHADFVLIVMKSASSGAKQSRKSVDLRQAKANVRTADNGDIWIEGVPMVHLTMAVESLSATAERVLRYFGYTNDELEIAQAVFNATIQHVGGMREPIRKMVSVCRLGCSDIVSMVDNPRKEIKNYNLAAKKLKEPEISYEQFCHVYTNTFRFDEMLAAMDKYVMYEMRMRDPRAKMFEKVVREQIDKGNPVFWFVKEGIYSETGSSYTPWEMKCFSMRLILGYNKKTNEILYSDPYRAGRRLYRMPADWAFTITVGAFFLRPL